LGRRSGLIEAGGGLIRGRRSERSITSGSSGRRLPMSGVGCWAMVPAAGPGLP